MRTIPKPLWRAWSSRATRWSATRTSSQTVVRRRTRRAPPEQQRRPRAAALRGVRRTPSPCAGRSARAAPAANSGVDVLQQQQRPKMLLFFNSFFSVCVCVCERETLSLCLFNTLHTQNIKQHQRALPRRRAVEQLAQRLVVHRGRRERHDVDRQPQLAGERHRQRRLARAFAFVLCWLCVGCVLVLSCQALERSKKNNEQ